MPLGANRFGALEQGGEFGNADTRTTDAKGGGEIHETGVGKGHRQGCLAGVPCIMNEKDGRFVRERGLIQTQEEALLQEVFRVQMAEVNGGIIQGFGPVREPFQAVF